MEPVNVNLRGDGREWNLIAGEKSKLSTRSTRHAYHVGILQAKTNGRMHTLCRLNQYFNEFIELKSLTSLKQQAKDLMYLFAPLPLASNISTRS